MTVSPANEQVSAGSQRAGRPRVRYVRPRPARGIEQCDGDNGGHDRSNDRVPDIFGCVILHIAPSQIMAAALWAERLQAEPSSHRSQRHSFVGWVAPLARDPPASSARLSSRTFTPGSPSRRRLRGSVCSRSMAIAFDGKIARPRHAGGLEFGVRDADVRIEAAAGARHGVGRHGCIAAKPFFSR